LFKDEIKRKPVLTLHAGLLLKSMFLDILLGNHSTKTHYGLFFIYFFIFIFCSLKVNSVNFSHYHINEKKDDKNGLKATNKMLNY